MNVRTPLMAFVPLLAFVVAPAHSANICVNPSSASCSATIQAGIDAAAIGDSVSISGGFYNENVTIATDGITLRGGKGAVLDGDDPLSGIGITVNADGVTVQGFTIRNGQSYGIEVNGSGATIRNMSISGPNSSCIYIAGSDATISSNRIRGCGSEAVYVNSANNVSIVRNTISQCDSSCLDVTGDGFVIERNNIQITEDSYLIDVSGDDGDIVNNNLSNSDSESISASGDNILVSGNKMSVGSAALDLNGANPVVTRNRGRYVGSGSDAFDVNCSAPCDVALVSNNRIEDVRDDTGGFTVSASGVGMIVERNTARRTEDYGMNISGTSSITVRNNSVSTVGGDSDTPCFYVSGTGGHVVEDNRGSDCHGDGVYATGTGHSVDDNHLRDVLEDGISVQGGTNITVTDNTIRDAHGVGVDAQSSTGTTLDGNRINGARLGICDEATGSTVTNNTTTNADLPDQLNTAAACPIN
jgi:parallel beta-helix repeat protein